jgi:hypothetical protein
MKAHQESTAPVMATRNEDDKVRCSICLEFNKRDYRGNWVLKTTFASHSKHPTHLKALENQEQFLSARIEDMPENYAALQDIIMDSPPRPQSFFNNQSGMMDAEQEMFAAFDGNYELDPSEMEIHQQKCREFNRQIEEYGLWDGLEGLPDDEMADIAEICDNDEQEEMISELLERTCGCFLSTNITDKVFRQYRGYGTQ